MLLTREDNLQLKIALLPEGIIRIHAGGIDGFQDSLLNRYEFIQQLEEETKAEWSGNRLELADGYALQFNDDLTFSLFYDGKPLFETANGYCPGMAATCFQNRGYSFCSTIADDEKMIGFGDQYRQGFLLNGQRESLWIRNQSDYIPVPFFMSSKGYGILFNTTRRLYYDFGVSESGKITIDVANEYLDIYLFTGKDYWDIIRKYTMLTGRPQIPPKYTFGLWLVANSEIRAHELLQLAAEMRREKIPCDILALEPLWMEKVYDESLDKKWNEERFPYAPWAKPADTFIGNLKLMGYHFGLWMLSNYDHTWEEERRLNAELPDVYDSKPDFRVDNEAIETVEEDEHFGHEPMRMDKITKPEEPFFEHLEKFIDQGVDYFKQDGFAQINLHPDRFYAEKYHDDVMHNIHYMIYTRQMLRGFEAHTGRRGFTMAVAGWAGFQHFSGTWTGDTGGGAQSLCGILQLATVGHAFATCDMDVNSAPSVHMGMLLPWSQVCSWAYYRYPLYKGEKLKNIFRNYLNLRMQLTLFFYALAREASLSGKAIVRPMHLVYPDVDVAYTLTKQFMLGDALLVGVYSDKWVLPAGQWFNYWTNQLVDGNWSSNNDCQVPEECGGALLMKAGAIMPLIPVQQYVDELPLTTLTWQIFPTDGCSEFSLYLDDGLNLDYKNGAYAEASIYCEKDDTQIAIYWGDITGNEPERITDIDYTVELLGVTDATSVTVNGKEQAFEVNQRTNRIIISKLRFSDKVIITE